MLNHELMDAVLNDADKIPPAAEKLREYPRDVFNYKPSGGWSAAECIDHLIIINKTYIPVFEDISKIYATVGEIEFTNSFVGRFLIKTIHPDAPRKVKTARGFQPVRSNADLEIIDEYLRQHFELRKYMKLFRDFDLKKIKVQSPMSSIVTYNLGDACRIIIYHDLRHLKQGQRAVETYFSIMHNEA